MSLRQTNSVEFDVKRAKCAARWDLSELRGLEPPLYSSNESGEHTEWTGGPIESVRWYDNRTRLINGVEVHSVYWLKPDGYSPRRRWDAVNGWTHPESVRRPPALDWILK